MSLQRRAGRLPAPTPALRLVIRRWRIERKIRGATWCKTELIGAIRKDLDVDAAREGLEHLAYCDGGVSVKEADDICREALRSECAACGLCEMARQHVMEHQPALRLAFVNPQNRP